MAGTFAYMAPECFEGKGCTEAVDVFSFGVSSLGCWLQYAKTCTMQPVSVTFLQ